MQKPRYSVLFSTELEIVELGLLPGMPVDYAMQTSKVVFAEQLKQLKGSDASNVHDEEPAEHEMEFSDDEKERLHKLQWKREKINKKRDGQVNKAMPTMHRPPPRQRQPTAPPLAYGDDDLDMVPLSNNLNIETASPKNVYGGFRPDPRSMISGISTIALPNLHGMGPSGRQPHFSNGVNMILADDHHQAQHVSLTSCMEVDTETPENNQNQDHPFTKSPDLQY